MAQSCPANATATVSVTVKDGTGAVVANANVTLDGASAETTDKTGWAVYRCVTAGRHMLHVEAENFAARDVTVSPGAAEIQVRLEPHVNETVNAVDDSGVGATENAGGEKTLNSKDLAAMADDPDDFQQELQALAAASGGSPGAATITVDGFQGASKMPPKSAIAFIKVNPDLFSAEYAQPPYQGGRIEVYTKPGQSQYHGALFFTYGGSALNARDPYAVSTQATGKRRYGFELTGPAWSKKSDFTLDLEKRDIDEYAVVNATTLAGNLVQSVATPQRLWQGNARLDMQWGPKTISTLAYEADVNNLSNQGVGGATLAEAGYNTVQSEYTVRWTAISTVSPNLIHESHASFQWQDRDDTPNSTGVSVQVAGAFTGGGVTTQALHSHVKNIEEDDDAIWNHKKHMVKIGMQMLDAIERVNAPTNFNGTYTFGGGPGMTGLQQYQGAQATPPTSTATAYSITTGNPEIDFNQFRLVLFVQDQWKLRPRLQFALGLRYALQTEPGTYANFAPRAGVAWSPDKKQKWVLRARTGLFTSPIAPGTTLQTLALNGVRQQQTLVYGANYCNPVSPTCNPVPAGATSIQTLQPFAGGVSQSISWQSQLGVEHDLPGHWHAQANLYLAKGWGLMRSRNVNAPLNGLPNGPRPGAANENVFQYQQTGNLHGNVIFLGVDQRTMKRLLLFVGYIRMDLRTDADSANFFPQSANTDAGETARASWETTHRILAFGQLNLPWKLALSEQMNLASGAPYNVTTGFDNNGDGVFNDRPQYASAPGPGVYATQFGLLTSSGGTGVMPRNAGTMPWTVHLDANLARTFTLTKGGDHPQSLALNVRSANVLNHTNVTAVDGVLGSPQFAQAVAADSGRRIEFGARYSF